MIFVRHNDSTDPDFSPNSTGWEIISELAPLRNEKIIDKIYNSAFHHTELHVYLKNKNISSIILVGMQTEYCMDASCKTAFDLGYQITIPLECHALFQMICALLQQYQSCLQIVFGAIDLQTSALQEIY